MEQERNEVCNELLQLSHTIQLLFSMGEYAKCRKLIADAMSRYPDAAQPHNLFGLMLEREGHHSTAMRHFRAAWALDPTYLPARQNMECYGTFYGNGCCAFDETDCAVQKENSAQAARMHMV